MSLRRLLVKILWCVAALGAVWLAGLCWFVQQVPASGAELPLKPVDAVVVLTGGKGRLDYGLKLLKRGEGKALFVSGVNDHLELADLLANVSAASRAYAQQAGIPPIILGHEANNTIGNALETSRWLSRNRYTSICLVTADYHMPRALEEFHHAMPELTIMPAPIFTGGAQPSWWQSKEEREHLLAEYHKYLASRIRHWYVGA